MGVSGRQTARQVAFWVLSKFDVNRHDAGELLHKRISLTDQRGQATDIVYGAIRNMPAIDMVIEQVGSTPIKRISKKLLAILRIGAYELIYAPQTAEYAIVNEAVELAHSITGKKPAGFVNAVLRNLGRAISCRDASLEDFDSWSACSHRLERALRLSSMLKRGNSAPFEKVVGNIEDLLERARGKDRRFLSANLMRMLLEFKVGDFEKYAAMAAAISILW